MNNEPLASALLAFSRRRSVPQERWQTRCFAPERLKAVIDRSNDAMIAVTREPLALERLKVVAPADFAGQDTDVTREPLALERLKAGPVLHWPENMFTM